MRYRRCLRLPPQLFESLDDPDGLFEQLRRGLEPGIAPSEEIEEHLERFRRHIQELEEKIQERMGRLQEELLPDASLQGQIS